MFLAGPAVRMRGRGLRVDRLEMVPFYAVLALPEIRCPTRQVYAAYDAAPPAEAPAPGRWDRMVASGAISGPPSAWRDGLVNDLAAPALGLRPELGDVIERLRAAVGVPVYVTGSGSAVFALFDTAAEARSALAHVPEELRTRCRVVTLNPW
jgi:4-diphosphocytidyl-2-C-methyl-D-erythritol kinase